MLASRACPITFEATSLPPRMCVLGSRLQGPAHHPRLLFGTKGAVDGQGDPDRPHRFQGSNMTEGIPRVCACGFEVVPYGQSCSCAMERKAAADKARPSSSARGYDSTWRKVAKAFRLAFPTCCTEGCGKATTDVDHVKSIREAPQLRLDWSNLRAFCHGCHSRHTARTQGFAKSGG